MSKRRPELGGIVVYGAAWCEDTEASRAKLSELGVAYDYVDVDEQAEAAAFVRRINRGRQKTPTITFGHDSPPLVEPSDEELESRLRQEGYLDRH